jgi:membrane fusion protein (multidrug efflux system)
MLLPCRAPGFRRLPLLGAALVLPILGCGGGESRARGAPGGGPFGEAAQAKPVSIAVERVATADIASYYTATATIEAANRAEVLARTTGVVRRILREEGDRVEAGETLLLLEDDQAKLRVMQAEANALTARSEHERKVSMRESGLLSAGEFEAVEGNRRVREAELELAKLELEHTRIPSPFEGRVVRRFVDLGANVSPGIPLFEVMDDDPLLARVFVPARRMGFLEPGQRIDIHLDSGNVEVEGVVTLVSPIVDATTGTVKVTAELRKRPAGIRPGDFAQVKIVTERHAGAVVVPSKAVVEDQGEKVVYVIADGKAVRRAVQTGFVEGDLTEIVSGLAAGEVLCVKGQRDLRDGAPVEILEGPPDLVTKPAAAPTDSSKGDGEKSAS